ncbi:MAG: 30S ribosomal protein S4 [Candidatus Portnoybacteria bacterium]
MILNAKCKRCRRSGEKLFLKGERCFSQKCAMVRRPYPPGVHGKGRRARLSEYGQQLAEKQKLRYAYGISEEQFRKYFKEIADQKGNKEELLAQNLERRLDNVVFRLGWAKSRNLARQIVSHSHVHINGRRLNIPSYQVRKGDIITLKENSKKLTLFKDIRILLKKHQVPTWLVLDKEKLEANVKGEPKLENLDKISQISMIIEYYSR